MADYLSLHDWTSQILKTLAEHTDRKVVISEKGRNSFSECIEDAWCLVTHHSNCAVDALVRGIPSIVLGRKLGSLGDIENPPMDRSVFAFLANNQFTLDEIRGGLPWILDGTNISGLHRP